MKFTCCISKRSKTSLGRTRLHIVEARMNTHWKYLVVGLICALRHNTDEGNEITVAFAVNANELMPPPVRKRGDLCPGPQV